MPPFQLGSSCKQCILPPPWEKQPEVAPPPGSRDQIKGLNCPVAVPPSATVSCSGKWLLASQLSDTEPLVAMLTSWQRELEQPAGLKCPGARGIDNRLIGGCV